MAALLIAVVILNAGFTAVNAALYVAEGQPISLGAAVFCGLMFAWSLAMLLRS